MHEGNAREFSEPKGRMTSTEGRAKNKSQEHKEHQVRHGSYRGAVLTFKNRSVHMPQTLPDGPNLE